MTSDDLAAGGEDAGAGERGLALTTEIVPPDQEPSGSTPAAVIRVSGEIDVATGTKLRAALADALAKSGVDPVMVDLTAVTFMSSTGIAVLVDAHSEARQKDKSLRFVTGDNQAVLTPLRVSGVDLLLNLEP